MSASRDELHHLIDGLPDDQVAAVVADVKRRMARPPSDENWPPEFFNIVDGSEIPSDVGENVDLHLAALGFGRDFL